MTSPSTNNIFRNSVPYVVDSDGNYAVPVASPDGSPLNSTIAVYSEDCFQQQITSANASSGVTVKAAVADKRIYIKDLLISVDTTMSVTLKDEDDTTLIPALYVYANSTLPKSFIVPVRLAVGKGLKVVTSTSGNISILVTGYAI